MIGLVSAFSLSLVKVATVHLHPAALSSGVVLHPPCGVSPHSGPYAFSALLSDCNRPWTAGSRGAGLHPVSVAIVPVYLRGPLSLSCPPTKDPRGGVLELIPPCPCFLGTQWPRPPPRWQGRGSRLLSFLGWEPHWLTTYCVLRGSRPWRLRVVRTEMGSDPGSSVAQSWLIPSGPSNREPDHLQSVR